MSWQLAAFAILGLGLLGGFAWYERTRPDARIVALVATLAAFAALGRIAFAAVPNVKPTTDIVLISGYALGAGPGFVVGALAGLVSNFFFGQGPWTPWQMAAWGVTGVIGAWLAVITRRRIGRWPLAIVCAVVGFAFTAAQDFGDWVTYSDHSLAQLGVYVGKGIGFDAIHATGCFVFALAFGPALLRSIARFTARLQVKWIAPRATTVPVAIVIGVLTAWLASQPGSITGVARAAATPSDYLLSAQNADGGLGQAPGQPSGALFSGWAALGLAADGINPQRVVKDGHSLAAYIERGGGSDAGSLERTVLALRASGLPATTEVAALERRIGTNGSVADQTNLTAFALLALKAAGVPPPGAMPHWLARQQDRDGGFNFATAGGASDVDDTGAVLEALGPDPRAVALHRAQPGQRRRLCEPVGQRVQRPVDGLGGPGADRRRRRRRRGRPGGLVPELADRPRRAHPVLELGRPDAGVGDRRGADGARAQATPAGPCRAPVDRLARRGEHACHEAPSDPPRPPRPPLSPGGAGPQPALRWRRRPAGGRLRRGDRARARATGARMSPTALASAPDAGGSPQGDGRRRAAGGARARRGGQARARSHRGGRRARRSRGRTWRRRGRAAPRLPVRGRGGTDDRGPGRRVVLGRRGQGRTADPRGDSAALVETRR